MMIAAMFVTLVVIAYTLAEAFGLWDEERADWERKMRHDSITRDVQEFRRAEWKRATEQKP